MRKRVTRVLAIVGVLWLVPVGIGLAEENPPVCPQGWDDVSVGQLKFCKRPSEQVAYPAAHAWKTDPPTPPSTVPPTPEHYERNAYDGEAPGSYNLRGDDGNRGTNDDPVEDGRYTSCTDATGPNSCVDGWDTVEPSNPNCKQGNVDHMNNQDGHRHRRAYDPDVHGDSFASYMERWRPPFPNCR